MLSSYGATDAIIQLLLDKRSYPNLKLITVSGYSAGGQYVQRYAYATEWGGSKTVDKQGNTTIRFVSSSASTYLYLSKLRPRAVCSPLRDTGLNWTCDSWYTPTSPAVYDNWRFGREFNRTDPRLLYLRSVDPEVHTKEYAEKQILYSVGGVEYCNCATEVGSNDRQELTWVGQGPDSQLSDFPCYASQPSLDPSWPPLASCMQGYQNPPFCLEQAVNMSSPKYNESLYLPVCEACVWNRDPARCEKV